MNTQEENDPFHDLPPPRIIADDVPVVGFAAGALGFAFLIIGLHEYLGWLARCH